MADINGISGNTPKWNVILDNLQQANGVQGGNDAGKVEDKNLVLTEKEGQPVHQPSTPQIEQPELQDSSPEDVDSLVTKLGTQVFNFSGEELTEFSDSLHKTINTFKSAAAKGMQADGEKPAETQQANETPKSPSTNTSKMFFDVYQMLALLAECAQSLKDAARDQRQAEMSAVITSIQNQADAQRSAALTGMIAGGLICAVQLGASGYAAYKTVSNVAADAQLSTQFGVDTAATEMNTAQTELDTARTELNNFNSEHPVPEEGQPPDVPEVAQQRTQLQTRVNEAKANLMDKKISYESKMTAMKNSPEFQALEKSQAWTKAFGEISQAFGNFGQTVVRGAADVQQADATALGANQKKGEEELAQTKDMMESFQGVIDKMLQLLQALQQAENQSMSDAIHA